MNRVKNKILDSEFKKNIVKLTSGLSISQLIPIFITPILTQFFSPEQFGVYGLFVSIYTILGVISSGKYDMAIMLPKNKKDSINILVICLVFSLVFSLLIFIILFSLKNLLFEITQLDLFGRYFWIIPFSILLFSINQSSLVWFNRNKKYNIINEHNLLKSSSNSFSSFILGIKSISFGLVIGNVISLLMTSLFNILDLLKERNFLFISIKGIKKNFYLYINFLKYSTISNLFNSLSGLGMTSIIVFFYGAKTAGLYFLAEKLIAIPLSFITNSISQVYFQKASILFHSDKSELLKLSKIIQKKIFLILFPFLFLMSFLEKKFFYCLVKTGKELAKY